MARVILHELLRLLPEEVFAGDQLREWPFQWHRKVLIETAIALSNLWFDHPDTT